MSSTPATIPNYLSPVFQLITGVRVAADPKPKTRRDGDGSQVTSPINGAPAWTVPVVLIRDSELGVGESVNVTVYSGSRPQVARGDGIAFPELLVGASAAGSDAKPYFHAYAYALSGAV